MKEGELFATLADLEKKIKEYEDNNFITLQKRNVTLLSQAVKKYPRAAKARQDLKYYLIEYACSKGGKRFKSRGKAIRKSSTMYEGCQMKIKIVLTEDGQHLRCKLIQDEHNHEINENTYKHFAKKRKLESDDRKEVQHLLKLRANPKDVQQYIMKKTGKIVLTKDIRNIKYITKLPLKSNDLEELVSILSENEGSTVEIAHDQSGNLIGIFYQDFFMKHVFNTFPELLICDATYKLNELNMALYILLAVDGNGQSEIVCTFLMADESKAAIEIMIKTFKNNNESWLNTVTILTDKDMTERNIFKAEFPQANLLICLFHTLRTFRREITVEKMGITKEVREKCLHVIQKLAHSFSEEEYENNYEALRKLNVKNVIKYYDENWHTIRHEWVEAFKSYCFTLNNTTTNRLESINQKIKSGVERHSSLCQLYIDFKMVLQSLRIDRDHSAHRLLYKTPVTQYQISSAEYLYIKLITPFAWSCLEPQFMYIEINVQKLKPGNEQSFMYDSKREGKLSVTVDNCSCRFRNQMKLPCRHILAVRKYCNVTLFDEALVNKRWLAEFYLANHRATMKDTPMYDSQVQVISEHDMSKPILNQHQKFREASKLCNSLAVTISQYGSNAYREIMDQMKLLTSLYQNKKKVLIVEVLDQKNIETEECSNPSNPDIIASSHSSHREITQEIEIENFDVPENLKLTDAEILLENSTVSQIMEKLPDQKNLTEASARRRPLDSNINQEKGEHDHKYVLREIQVPPKMVKCGRPKGSALTVIGTKKKRRNTYR